MDSYIVRIYRRDVEDPGKIAGLVEVVGEGEVKKFTDREGLYRVICKEAKKRKGKATISVNLPKALLPKRN